MWKILPSLPIQDQVARFDTQRRATPGRCEHAVRFACPEPVSNRGIRLDQGSTGKAFCICGKVLFKQGSQNVFLTSTSTRFFIASRAAKSKASWYTCPAIFS